MIPATIMRTNWMTRRLPSRVLLIEAILHSSAVISITVAVPRGSCSTEMMNESAAFNSLKTDIDQQTIARTHIIGPTEIGELDMPPNGE